MSRCGRQLPMRHATAFAAVLFALLTGPAQAFFRPGHHPPPPGNKPPIHVPAPPPVVVPPVVTPPGGGTGGGPPPPVLSAPEPNGLALALLGSGGLSLFLVCRRLAAHGTDRGRRVSAAPATDSV